ncbi:MAG TPA: hypothetical protein VL200_15335 [Lacunisphaera sp.]|jgi:hypothetical protein|nr:hypothetical protein [Lacunisphaera sp.]
MEEDLELRRLRRQRNALVTFAIVILLGSFFAALPGSLARYRGLRAGQAELVDLQAQITSVQSQIVTEQGQILEVQKQIAELQRQ